MFRNDFENWDDVDVKYQCTVDRSAPDWDGNVGLITSLIPGVDIDPANTIAVVVGPPIMYKFVIAELLTKQIPSQKIFVSLERHMKCGVGKCGHCQIGKVYCCTDGPIFSYEEIKNEYEAL